MADELDIEVTRRGRVCILRLTGELKIGDATIHLRDRYEALIERGERFFILDLRDVRWLDSSGIGEIVACYKRVHERRGELHIVSSGKASSLFTFNQLNKLFRIHTDPEPAYESLAGEPAGAFDSNESVG